MPPPLPVQPPARPRHRGRPGAHALDEPRPRARVGLIGTLAAHAVLLLVLLSLPDDLLGPDADTAAAPADRVFEIELSPELFSPASPPAPLEPPRFVEVNPAAPENPPDDTPLFGAQNQQVAQPTPSPVEPDTHAPASPGDEPADNATAIVRGQAAEPVRPAASEILAQAFQPQPPPSPVPEPDRSPAEREAARAINAPGGGESLLGAADDSPGSTVTTLPPVPGAENGERPVEGSATGRARTGGYFAGTPAIDRARPMDRPRLSAETLDARNTPTIRNQIGTENIDAIAYDARWSAYGEYLQRLLDAVQAQWERLILRSAYYPAGGSRVTIVFKLNDQGEVTQIVSAKGEGGEVAVRLCASAIAERAPYGPWPEDMKGALGKEQTLTFTFHYQ